MWTRNPILEWRAVILVLSFCTLFPIKSQTLGYCEFLVVTLKVTASFAQGGAQAFQPIAMNQVLRIGDRVKVDPESQIGLRYGHLQILRYDERSEFVIEAPRTPTSPK